MQANEQENELSNLDLDYLLFMKRVKNKCLIMWVYVWVCCAMFQIDSQIDWYDRNLLKIQNRRNIRTWGRSNKKEKERTMKWMNLCMNDCI